MGSACAPIRVAGIQALTTVEWEGKLSAVLFLADCPWRCRYCHNTHLIAPPADSLIPWNEVIAFLTERQGFLDGVVFSGGEPTFQAGLGEAVQAVKALGFAVAIHTNGHAPETLRRLLEAGGVDYVAMDAKAPFEDYEKVTRVRGSGEMAAQSARVIIAADVEHEFRTTYHPALLSQGDILSIATALHELGAQAYYLQSFRVEGCADSALSNSPQLPGKVPPELASELSSLFPRFGLRGFDV